MLRILQSFLTAALLGAFIGFQKEKESQQFKFQRFAGLRTSIFITLLGSLAGYMSITNEWLLYISYAIFGTMIVAVYIHNAYLNKKPGGTDEISLLLLFLIGVLTSTNQTALAIIITIFMGFIHSLRNTLHKLTERFTESEVLDTLKFATITFVVLPLLPDKAIDPFGIFNPYNTWLMVVFISGISFVGYIAAKFVGQKKGIALAGVLGGIASSTAVTTTMAAANKKNPALVNPFAFAICVASAVMFGRVLVEVIIINSQLFTKLLIPLGLMILTALGVAIYFWYASKEEKKGRPAGKHSTPNVEDIGLESPFTIAPAIKFGVFFIFILTLVRFAELYLGEQGVYLTALISGFADVDAIVISLSNLSLQSVLDESTAIRGITIAVMVNTGVKLLYVHLFASSKLTKTMLAAFGIILPVGIAAAWLI